MVAQQQQSDGIGILNLLRHNAAANPHHQIIVEVRNLLWSVLYYTDQMLNRSCCGVTARQS